MVLCMDKWAEYVSTLTKGVGIDESGRRVGVDGSTISRWRNGKAMPRNPAEAAALAVAFGADVLEAFVAAGYLTPAEAKRPRVQSLKAVPDRVLVDEIARRLGQGGATVTPIRPDLSPVDDTLDAAALDAKEGVDETPGGSEPDAP